MPHHNSSNSHFNPQLLSGSLEPTSFIPKASKKPVLTLTSESANILDPAHIDTVAAMWFVFSKCSDFLENGRRLENMSLRLWNKDVLSKPALVENTSTSYSSQSSFESTSPTWSDASRQSSVNTSINSCSFPSLEHHTSLQPAAKSSNLHPQRNQNTTCAKDKHELYNLTDSVPVKELKPLILTKTENGQTKFTPALDNSQPGQQQQITPPTTHHNHCALSEPRLANQSQTLNQPPTTGPVSPAVNSVLPPSQASQLNQQNLRLRSTSKINIALSTFNVSPCQERRSLEPSTENPAARAYNKLTTTITSRNSSLFPIKQVASAIHLGMYAKADAAVSNTYSRLPKTTSSLFPVKKVIAVANNPAVTARNPVNTRALFGNKQNKPPGTKQTKLSKHGGEFTGIDSNGSKLTYSQRSNSHTSIVKGFDPSIISVSRNASVVDLESCGKALSVATGLADVHRSYSVMSTTTAAARIHPGRTLCNLRRPPADSAQQHVYKQTNHEPCVLSSNRGESKKTGLGSFVPNADQSDQYSKARPDQTGRKNMFFFESSPSESEHGTGHSLSPVPANSGCKTAEKPAQCEQQQRDGVVEGRLGQLQRESSEMLRQNGVLGPSSLDQKVVFTNKAKFNLAGKESLNEGALSENDRTGVSLKEVPKEYESMKEVSKEYESMEEDDDYEFELEDEDEDEASDGSSWDSENEDFGYKSPCSFQKTTTFLQDKSALPRAAGRPSLLLSLFHHDETQDGGAQEKKEIMQNPQRSPEPKSLGDQSEQSKQDSRKPCERLESVVAKSFVLMHAPAVGPKGLEVATSSGQEQPDVGGLFGAKSCSGNKPQRDVTEQDAYSANGLKKRRSQLYKVGDCAIEDDQEDSSVDDNVFGNRDKAGKNCTRIAKSSSRIQSSSTLLAGQQKVSKSVNPATDCVGVCSNGKSLDQRDENQDSETDDLDGWQLDYENFNYHARGW